MSTIVVVRKDGVAAIAADSLTTWGSAKDSAEYLVAQHKILRLQDSYLAISGPTSAKLAIADYFASAGEINLNSVEEIFRSWLKLHSALRNKYFMIPTENSDDAFESSRVDALIANPSGIFGVDAHRAVQEFSKFYSYGSGWRLALGAMYAAYPRTDLSAEAIAKIGISAAAEFDAETGLPVESYAVRLLG